MHTATCAGSCGVSVPGVPAASPARCLDQASHKAAPNVQLQAWPPPFPKKQVFWVSPAPEAGHMPSLREKPVSPVLSHFSEQWHHGDPLKVGYHPLLPMRQETGQPGSGLLSHLPASHGPSICTLHGHAPLPVLGDSARDGDGDGDSPWWEQPQGRSRWSCECKHLELSPKYCCPPTGLESLPRLERWDVEGR